MSPRPRILYIMCPGHSGSTLLDLLISRHSRIGTVGELKCVTTKPGAGCLCGVRPFSACAFWREVGVQLKASSGLALAELDLVASDLGRFVAHNSALYAAISAVSGKSVLVDSSKLRSRLEGMLASDAFEVTPIHLVRDPRGIVYSHVRKGRSLVQHSHGYARASRSMRRALEGHAHVRVRYEELARDPERVLGRVMRELGFELEPQQLDWSGAGERHSVGGNHMRHGRDSTIRLDEEWRSGMSLWQKLLVRAMAGGE
jgi:hypothetical protein